MSLPSLLLLSTGQKYSAAGQFYLSAYGAAPDDNPLAAALRNLRDRLRFTPEERLLLRLVYQEGMTVTDAGKHLSLGVNSVQGKMRRLLERIRSTLRAVGLDRTLAEAITEEELES